MFVGCGTDETEPVTIEDTNELYGAGDEDVVEDVEEEIIYAEPDETLDPPTEPPDEEAGPTEPPTSEE